MRPASTLKQEFRQVSQANHQVHKKFTDNHNMRTRTHGFTLAELLISLAILGVIATFTIPKILQAQQNKAWNSAAKEAFGTVSQAYFLYRLANGDSDDVKPADIFPYMNYISYETATEIDHVQGNVNIKLNCDTNAPCVRLHNGGVLRADSVYFGTAGSDVSSIFFGFDPDGRVTDGTTDGPGKLIFIDLYQDGSVRSRASRKVGTKFRWTSGGGDVTAGPNPNADPDWFSWD